jgi:hypothetical protein
MWQMLSWMWPAGFAFGAIALSIALSFLGNKRLRIILLASLWLSPIWLAIWFTARFSEGIGFEFGSPWAFLFFSAACLPASAIFTIFPFQLAVRLRQNYRGI